MTEQNQKSLEAFRASVREAVWTHARLGRPVCEWVDGKVVWVQPEEMLARLAANPLPDNRDSTSK